MVLFCSGFPKAGGCFTSWDVFIVQYRANRWKCVLTTCCLAFPGYLICIFLDCKHTESSQTVSQPNNSLSLRQQRWTLTHFADLNFLFELLLVAFSCPSKVENEHSQVSVWMLYCFPSQPSRFVSAADVSWQGKLTSFCHRLVELCSWISLEMQFTRLFHYILKQLFEWNIYI